MSGLLGVSPAENGQSRIVVPYPNLYSFQDAAELAHGRVLLARFPVLEAGERLHPVVGAGSLEGLARHHFVFRFFSGNTDSAAVEMIPSNPYFVGQPIEVPYADRPKKFEGAAPNSTELFSLIAGVAIDRATRDPLFAMAGRSIADHSLVEVAPTDNFTSRGALLMLRVISDMYIEKSPSGFVEY
jgi:hypothetical protein